MSESQGASLEIQNTVGATKLDDEGTNNSKSSSQPDEKKHKKPSKVDRGVVRTGSNLAKSLFKMMYEDEVEDE